MKRKNLLKILGLLILVGNVANAEYSGKFEKTYSKNSDYKMVVATGDRIRIQKAKESFSQFLDKIDPEINDMNIEDILKDFEDETEEEDMKEEDELKFWN